MEAGYEGYEPERDDVFAGWSIERLHAAIDLIMCVLARHDGKIIRNDCDLPVALLEESQVD